MTATGARPIAVTDNMNFGNPRCPSHGRIRRCHSRNRRGLPRLDFPVVSGNVSLYNETEGRPILPTPRSARSA